MYALICIRDRKGHRFYLTAAFRSVFLNDLQELQKAMSALLAHVALVWRRGVFPPVRKFVSQFRREVDYTLVGAQPPCLFFIEDFYRIRGVMAGFYWVRTKTFGY